MLPPLVDRRGNLSPELLQFIQGLADQLTPIPPPVSSVDGRTGAVTLADLYDAYGTAGGLVASHETEVDPHPQYATDAELSVALAGLGTAAAEDVSAFDAAGTASTLVAAHVSDVDPHPTYTTAAELAVAISAISIPDEVSLVKQGVGGSQTLGTSAISVSSLTLPVVASGTIIEHICWGSITNSTGATVSYTPTVKLGSSSVAATSGSIATGSTQNWWIRSKIHFLTQTTQEILMESFISNANTSRFNTASWTEDGSTALALECLLASGSSSSSQTATRRSAVATIYTP